MLDAASSADMAAAAGTSMSIPPSATDPAAVTVTAAALSETTMCPPSSVDVDVPTTAITMAADFADNARHNEEGESRAKGSRQNHVLRVQTKSPRKPAFDPNVGHYDLKGTTYLEGQVYANVLEEGMPIQLWKGSTIATDGERRDLRNSSNWTMAL